METSMYKANLLVNLKLLNLAESSDAHTLNFERSLAIT